MATSLSLSVLAASASLACWRRSATSASARCLVIAVSRLLLGRELRGLSQLLAVPVGELALDDAPHRRLLELGVERLRARVDRVGVTTPAAAARRLRSRLRRRRARRRAARSWRLAGRAAGLSGATLPLLPDVPAAAAASSASSRTMPSERAARPTAGCRRDPRATRIRFGSKRALGVGGSRRAGRPGRARRRQVAAAGAGGSGAWNGNTAGAGRQSAKPGRQMRSVGFRCPCATKVRISTSDSGPCCLPSRAMYHWMSGCWPVMRILIVMCGGPTGLCAPAPLLTLACSHGANVVP